MKTILILIITLLLVSCGGPSMKIATFETNQGTFNVELNTKLAPITTANFIKLTESGFYDNSKFHRVIPNFMIQGGDPLSKDNSKKSSWGTGGPGYEIKDEFNPELSNIRGTISMANAGPDTGGSQFFINVVDNDYLDNKHAVFGTVTEGMGVVDKISRVKTESQNRPVEDVIITKVTIS